MTPAKVLLNLLESAIYAKAHYQIWWALCNQAHPRYDPAMNRFIDFFSVTECAHFGAMTVNLAHLFDKRGDSSSLLTYLRIDAAAFPSLELMTLKKRVESLALVAESVLKIRHKAVAHKDATFNEKQVFDDADITPDKIRDLIHSCADLVDDLRRRKRWSNGVFEGQRFADATLGLVQALDNSKAS